MILNKQSEILVMDDFLNLKDYTLVCDEIKKKEFEEIVITFPNGEEVSKYRRHYHLEPGPIIDIFDKKLYSKDLLLYADKQPELSWQWLRRSTKFEIQLTSYLDGGHYRWHTDHNNPTGNIAHRTFNFIYYLTDGKFTGGELQISNNIPADKPGEEQTSYTKLGYDIPIWKSIKPKKNRFVMLPSYYVHSVNKVNLDKNYKDLFDSRLSINGHLSLVAGS